MRVPNDLDKYQGCPEDGDIGFWPLAIGFLHRKRSFPTGTPPNGFLEKLKPFCLDPLTVCKIQGRMKCPICNERVDLDGEGLGSAEIRVLGKEDIYAAPDLIYHYIAVHDYIPPPDFVHAIMHGSPAGNTEHRALVNALR